MVKPGISKLLDEHRKLIAHQRVGVFTNHTGVLSDLSSSLDVIRQVADVRAIFSPEHGLHGVANAGERVANDTHRTGIPVYSLYGAQLAPTPDQFVGLDAIVCDIQDVGCRFYTYAWTMAKLIMAAAAAGVAVIVADRPNPIGGAIEGPGVEPGLRSLVGLHDVPVRHGLTIGELARLVNREERLGCDLTVVPCDGWSRVMRWSVTNLAWVPTSPNMPTPETALIYPGICLLEGVSVSVGRGTAKPFEWIGAPWIDGAALADALNAEVLPGVRWRTVLFEPCAAPYLGQVCAGVQPHVTDPDALRPVTMGIALLLALRQMALAHWASGAAETIGADQDQTTPRAVAARIFTDVAHFDRLAGSAHLREQIEAGALLAELASDWGHYEELFRARAAPVLLYT